MKQLILIAAFLLPFSLFAQEKTTEAPAEKKSLNEQAAEKNQQTSHERVEAHRQVIIGFGPTSFSNMNTDSTALGFQTGYLWNIDDHFDLGLKTDFAISTDHSDAYMLSGKIFTNYFFTSDNISPFVGAGFGYGWASIHNPGSTVSDDGAGGFAMSLQAGVKFFRISSVNFIVSGEYTRLFDSSSLGAPQAFYLKFGLLY